MATEWQCPYCKQWRSMRYTGCTHAVIPTEFDERTGKRRIVLGGKPETWTGERKQEYPTR